MRFFSEAMWQRLGDHLPYEDLGLNLDRARRWHPLNRSLYLGARVMLPGLLLQDAWRFAFFAAGAGRKAFSNDVVWGIALVPAMVVAARVGSVAAFVILGHWGGLAPATFFTVVISALGDRKNSLRDAVLLGILMTVVGALIFNVGLHLQLPLFTWGS